MKFWLFKSPNGNLKPPLLIISSLLMVVLVTGAYVNRPAGDAKTQADFTIESGSGAIIVANRLADLGIIRNPLVFRLFAYLTFQHNSIKKGIYPLNDGMSVLEVLHKITGGQTKTIRVTIPEGFNNRQIGDLLVEKKLIRSRAEFLQAAGDPVLLNKYNIPAKSAEGYLFPETYDIPVGYEAKRIVSLMIDLFLEKTATLENFPEDPEDRHNLIILASIVEREAQKKEERALIAGVFKNRMDANYPLESCATIQYLFEKPKQRLYFKDLEIKSPYNTYLNTGLPPGPIANAGLAAIGAALSPIQTEYKFFVVKGDGAHHFSKTFQEHVKAKQKYILR